jgi:DNA modification methylase
VKSGELWLLGGHRLLCGDATDAEDMARLMDGAQANMVFTDPPWNVAIGQDSNPRHRQRQGLANDDLSTAEFAAFLAAFASRMVRATTGDIYCVLGASEWPTLDLALRGAGLHWSATIIWVKDAFVLGRSKYHRRYEPLWYGWPGAGKSSFGPARDLDDVWEIPRPRRSEEHPTTKPVALVERAVANSSKPGGTVLDPFVGSGTTIIAAEQRDRLCSRPPRYLRRRDKL